HLHAIHRDMAHDVRASHAVRLGLKEIKGLAEDDAKRIVERRSAGYASMRELWLRIALSPKTIARLADADAFGSLDPSRRQALWGAKALGRAGDRDDLPLFGFDETADAVLFPSPGGGGSMPSEGKASGWGESASPSPDSRLATLADLPPPGGGDFREPEVIL